VAGPHPAPQPKIVPIDQMNSNICGAMASRQKPIATDMFRVAVAVWPIVSAMHVSSATH
jgi:hypothetical protein